MAHTRRTLTLDANWDLTLTPTGNIAVIDGGAATAQNVANECRLFTDDAYFAKDSGIPHFVVELGQPLSTSALRSYLRAAALNVDDVAEVTEVRFDGLDDNRVLHGEIQFTTQDGETAILDM